MSPFPPHRSEDPLGQSEGQSEPVAAYAPVLSKLAAGFTEFPRMAARKQAASLQLQLQAVEAEIRTLERGPRTRAAHRRLIALNRTADALALDLYKQRINAAPELVYSLDFPFYQNWGHGGLRWIFGSLRGRVGRDVYGVGLALGLLGALAVTLAAQPVADAWRGGDFAPSALLWLLMGCTLIWAYLAVTVKRYHDMDRSGLWVWIAAVPVFGLLWQVAECAFWPGTRGPNRYE